MTIMRMSNMTRNEAGDGIWKQSDNDTDANDGDVEVDNNGNKSPLIDK